MSATEGNFFSGQVASFTDANPTAPLTDFTTGTGGASINWGDSTAATSGTVTQPGGAGTAFIVSGSGVVLSACRYLDAVAAEVDVPLGLGSRHIAAANMSAATNAVGIVVSESSVVRLFCHGKLVAEIIPELWMIDHAAQLRGAVQREQVGELTVLTPSQRRASAVK